MTTKRIAFGLGGNIGDTRALCEQAITALCALPYLDTQSLKTSSYYTSPALLPEGAPDTWDQPFINQVVTLELDSTIADTPEIILEDVKTIEASLGRIKRGHWSPREIDIDIIAIERVNHQSEKLTIPHTEAHKRAFVVLPLAEIWEECELTNNSAGILTQLKQITAQQCKAI